MENAPPQFCGLSDTHGSYAILVYIVDSVYRHLATDRRIMTSIVGIRVGGFIQPQVFNLDISRGGGIPPPQSVAFPPPTTSTLPCSEHHHFRLSDCEFSLVS